MIVLDTHALLWWVNDDALLSKRAKSTINKHMSVGEIIVSSITAWEIAMLVKQNRLFLSMDVAGWLATVAEIEAVRFVPVDIDVSLKSVDLPGIFHKDPADRMIVATARKLAVSLVTKDEKIRNYPHVKTIW